VSGVRREGESARTSSVSLFLLTNKLNIHESTATLAAAIKHMCAREGEIQRECVRMCVNVHVHVYACDLYVRACVNEYFSNHELKSQRDF